MKKYIYIYRNFPFMGALCIMYMDETDTWIGSFLFRFFLLLLLRSFFSFLSFILRFSHSKGFLLKQIFVIDFSNFGVNKKSQKLKVNMWAYIWVSSDYWVDARIRKHIYINAYMNLNIFICTYINIIEKIPKNVNLTRNLIK